ncbi:MAG: sodium/solute symporter [Deltaproteobacteria bacterium]|nr:sodium/solute symporter [Deltaproteobacteria bacterium]
MTFGIADLVVFVVFVASVITVGLLKSKREASGEDYFLAGRGLHWWLIGFSLIAANISTEQFVGMSGNAASHVGLAIASYEWMAAITLVVVAFAFLPYFLRAGIYTIPEFLEVRYNAAARTIMAAATICIYMLLLGAVTYAGAVTISTLAAKMGYSVSLFAGATVIGLIAMVYVAIGGLKACAWADLIQGSALIVGGAVIMFFAFRKLGMVTEAAHVVDVQSGAVAIQQLAPDAGAFERFVDLNAPRLNMFLPASDPILPWTALLLGLWIPNFYYWGLNQYITQRTLGSASLAQGQKGIVFAAFMKLIIPFVIVIPGIIAFNLFAGDMRQTSTGDNAVVAARYVKANPASKAVAVVENPTDEQLAALPADRMVVAVLSDQARLDKTRSSGPNVLAMTKSAFDAALPVPYSTFSTDDKSFASVYPDLSRELEEFNRGVIASAASTGAQITSEKLIAYKYDTAMAQLIGNVLPQGVGFVGFVLAALLGAVVSSLAAMLNAASTIFTMDIYTRYIRRNASQKAIVFLGRACVVVFTGIAIFLAPQLGNPKISNSIFTIIQEGQGFISPGILAVFVFGLVVRRAPAMAGVVGLVTNIVAYGTLKLAVPDIQFLNRMALCFGLCIAVMAVLTLTRPLKAPIEFKTNTRIDLTQSRGALVAGIVVVVLTLALYVVFSPIGFAG